MKLECTPEQFLAIHKQADVQWAAPPITGAMQTLTQLNADGHLICFISSGKRSSIPIKVAKLMLDLPDIPYELHFTTEKWHVNVDVMIDDNPFFMRQWLMMFDMPPLLFYRQPWNADDITPPDSLNEVYTVTNWREVYKTINRDILGEEVQPVKDYDLGVYHINTMREIPVLARMLAKGQFSREKMLPYLRKKVWSMFSMDDPIPFFIHLINLYNSLLKKLSKAS